MSRQLALLFSYLFHPSLMPMAGTFAMVYTLPHYIPKNTIYVLLLSVFLSTYILPLLVSLVLLRLSIIPSLHLETSKSRRLPYLLAAAFYYFGAKFVLELPLPILFYSFLLGASVLLLVFFLLLSLMKLSAHMAGLGGIMALLTFMAHVYQINLIWPMAATALAAGLVGTARLSLEAHTPAEVYVGFVLAFGLIFGVLYLPGWLV